MQWRNFLMKANTHTVSVSGGMPVSVFGLLTMLKQL
jgi:hypothetical protein